jgi:hypothetical protein
MVFELERRIEIFSEVLSIGFIITQKACVDRDLFILLPIIF